MRGEVVYLYAFDIAYEADLAAIQKAMLGAVERFRPVRAKDAPRNFPVYQPLVVQGEEMRLEGPQGPIVLSTAIKFFGDWHLARVYLGCAARFHLPEWEGVVSDKLNALDGLYTMLQQDSMNRLMLILEISIVALFIIDVVIIVVLGAK